MDAVRDRFIATTSQLLGEEPRLAVVLADISTMASHRPGGPTRTG
ncbi:hypothetical protein SMICM17S_12739 [Streptomyces microflavus]